MQKLFYFLLGVMVGYYLAQYLSEEPPVVKAPVTPPAREPKPSAPPKHDTLTEISGIGPAYERLLNEMGVVNFQQLAQQDVDVLAGKMKRVSRDRLATWIQEAKARVNR
ncbi:MAG: DUF4332 domain-containing protein [Anaerolineae bacterium]|nr:DUF4332 domain-containing protein [Anaerolineae bacterium]